LRFGEEFPLDEPDSNYFTHMRKRLDKYYTLQADADAMNTTIWELSCYPFCRDILIPYDPNDPRRAEMFSERMSSQ
jgi:hypothetical protein